MPIFTPDYKPIVVRIRTEVPEYRLVDFAINFEALRAKGIAAMPAGYVIPDNEKAGANANAGAVSQKIVVGFSVHTFVKFAGDALGDEAIDLLKPLRDPLLEALLAWKPFPEADGVIHFAGAQRQALGGGTLQWRDSFTFEHRYRRAPS